MGNTSSSKDRHGEETVDYGYLIPQGGIYPSASRDWNQAIVAQLIVHRKLAPFYRPLEDYEEDWDDEQIIAAQKKPDQEALADDAGGSGALVSGSTSSLGHQSISSSNAPLQSATSALRHAAGKSAARSSSTPKQEVERNLEARLYRGAVDCPICFLYYPPNINQTRCCDHAICTECFVHIKRADPTTTHLVSEPACCPYCMQPNFGVIYVPPQWRAGIGAEAGTNPRPDFATHSSSNSTASNASTELGVSEGKRRRKSVSHTSRDVVTIDQIRPDWEAKLNAVRAQVARRANRRIVMRQVGDQLIPVGITSGRVVPLTQGAEGAVVVDESGGGRRRRRGDRSGGNGDFNQFLGQMQMGMGGPDLEELMIMEAMRLSMVEENERIRRQQETERNASAGGSSSAAPAPAAPLAISTPDSAPATISSYRPPVSGRLGELEQPTSSSLPQTSHMANAAPQQHSAPPSRRSFEPLVHPTPSALGGATASLAMALGASPTTQEQSGLFRQDASGNRSPPPPPPSQTSALSAMLGATHTATAILGARSSSEELASLPEPLTPEPITPQPTSSFQAAQGSTSRESPPIPQIVHHSPEPSGTITPTPAAAAEARPPLASVDSDDQAFLRDAMVAHLGSTQLSLATPASINSETAEEYDFLPSSPQSSAPSELGMHTPLIHDEEEEAEESDDTRSEAASDATDVHEPVGVRDSTRSSSPVQQ